MKKPAKIIFGVLIAVVLLNLFLLVRPGINKVVVIGFMTVIPDIALLYICIRLYLKFHNPYFKMMTVSYGMELAAGAFVSLWGDWRMGPLYLWFNDVTIFLVIYAALLYRERWEEDDGASVTERFSTLVPAAKTYTFWLILIGAPFALISIARFLTYYQAISYSTYLSSYLHNYAEMLTVLTATITWVLMLLIFILNLSLFRIYRILFFRYMYIMSLLTVINSVVWWIFSLYMSWLANYLWGLGKSNTLATLHRIGLNVLNLLPAIFWMAMPIATVIVFLYYAESREKEPTPAP